ncbi:peroxisomal ATPase PEX1 [Gastrophryne carolinensis]
MESRSRTHAEATVVELNRQLGEKLGLEDGQQVFLKPCPNVPSCREVTVEPLSADDWEILELHASALEANLLDQIRIVYPQAVFPVWVDLHTCFYIQIGSLTPAASVGRLEPLTELIVSPKSREYEATAPQLPDLGLGELHGGWAGVAPLSANSRLENNEDSSTCEGESESAVTQDPDAPASVWDTVGSLLSRALGFTARQDSGSAEKDPLLLRRIQLEGVFRVSRDVPDVVRSSRAFGEHSDDNTVHVFLWFPEPSAAASDVLVSYGRMVEIPSPKRRKKRSKTDAERSDGRTELAEGASGSHEAVVKIAWHGFEDIKDVIEYDTRNGNTHVAKVWVPGKIKKQLNINALSAVRIQSLESQAKVPSLLALHPKQPMNKTRTAAEITCAFQSWLESSSSSSWPWMSGKSGTLQLSIDGDAADFSYSLDDAAEETGQDDVYMLCPSRLRNTKIHVHMEPQSPEHPIETPQVDQDLPYMKMQNLGGADELLTSCYDHIVHCVMEHPWCRRLAPTASGLRNGAILLSGPKGCGKSTLAKALCKEASDNLEAYVEEIDCKLLKGKTLESICQTLEEGFAEAAWRQPAILLLDDLDHIVGVASGPEHEHSPEATQSKHLSYVLKDLMKEIMTMDTLIAVIATSQSERSLNPILVSTQGVHLFQCLKAILPPAQQERCEMMRRVIENRLQRNIGDFEDLDLHHLAKETEGFVAKDFTLLAERAVESSVASRRVQRAQGVVLTSSDFRKALSGFTPLSLKNAKLHKPKEQGWDMVGGLHDVRRALVDTIELPAKYPEIFANLPIRHRSGVLLYGAPGTGKTLLAGVVAHESGMNFISIKGPELLSKYIGASEQAVRDVFTRAQAAKPCILFFDEFDSIAPRRGHDNTGVTDRVVNQMLTQLDGVEGLHGVYVLAATSRPDLIDPALLRPGRLDNCLYCPPPDQASRYEILKSLSQRMALDEEVDLQRLAALTDNFTGADLKALLYNAQLEAIHSGLAPGAPRVQDNGSGSDSDASLSSLIFLNHSSVSDESTGEPDAAMDQSFTSLDTIRIPPADSKANIWRLYFGSSNDSDPGTGVSDKEESSRTVGGPKKTIAITPQHLMSALVSTRPSISAEDRRFFTSLYENFQNPKKSDWPLTRAGQRVTLA